MSLNTMLTRIEESFHAQEETTEKMKRFVSDASHELRTPLAAIHGYAELYKMQRDMPGALERADESIEHIEASSARMTVLVEDLLSLARLDEGRGIDITQQVKLTSVVNDAADDLHALDPDRGITCGQVVLQAGSDMEHPSRLAFQPGTMPDITLTGDASRLRQVVTNIVGNIHRYTPADSPVEVSMGVLPASISRNHCLACHPTSSRCITYRGHRGGAIHASRHELRNCAIQRSWSRRSRRCTLEDLRTVLHGGSVQSTTEGRYGSRHGDRPVRGQGTPWFHLRFRQ